MRSGARVVLAFLLLMMGAVILAAPASGFLPERPGALVRLRTMHRADNEVDPAHCIIEPRTLADLERLVTSRTPRLATERPKSGESIDPDSEIGKTVTSTLEMLFACLNAGDRMRAYAIYTDAYLARILQPGDLPVIATPQPGDPDEYTQIVAIDLHALDDGGVIAKVTLDPALIPVHKIFEFVMVPVDDGWRIDQVIDEINFSLP